LPNNNKQKQYKATEHKQMQKNTANEKCTSCCKQNSTLYMTAFISVRLLKKLSVLIKEKDHQQSVIVWHAGRSYNQQEHCHLLIKNSFSLLIILF